MLLGVDDSGNIFLSKSIVLKSKKVKHKSQLLPKTNNEKISSNAYSTIWPSFSPDFSMWNNKTKMPNIFIWENNSTIFM